MSRKGSFFRLAGVCAGGVSALAGEGGQDATVERYGGVDPDSGKPPTQMVDVPANVAARQCVLDAVALARVAHLVDPSGADLAGYGRWA